MYRASLVAQRLRVRLRTRVRAPVREDPTCHVPRSGKIPHAAEQLGPCAMAAEPVRPEPVLRNRRGHNSERPTYSKKKIMTMPQIIFKLCEKNLPDSTINSKFVEGGYWESTRHTEQ